PGAGAIALLDAFVEDAREEVEVGLHAVNLTVSPAPVGGLAGVSTPRYGARANTAVPTRRREGQWPHEPAQPRGLGPRRLGGRRRRDRRRPSAGLAGAVRRPPPPSRPG